jgi:hypothetical protein
MISRPYEFGVAVKVLFIKFVTSSNDTGLIGLPKCTTKPIVPILQNAQKINILGVEGAGRKVAQLQYR